MSKMQTSKMRKSLTSVLPPVAALLILSACGSGSNSAPAKAANGVSSAAATGVSSVAATAAHTAQGTLITADSERAEGYCTLDDEVMTAKGDDGNIVGAQKLEKSIRDVGKCVYNFSFPVKESATYSFSVGTYPFLTGNQKVAADLDEKLLFMIT